MHLEAPPPYPLRRPLEPDIWSRTPSLERRQPLPRLSHNSGWALHFPSPPGATESDVRRWHGSVFAPYFVPGCVARSSALISRIWARTAMRVSTFSRVQTPCLKLPLWAPFGPPEPLAPPCTSASASVFLILGSGGS